MSSPVDVDRKEFQGRSPNNVTHVAAVDQTKSLEHRLLTVPMASFSPRLTEQHNDLQAPFSKKEVREREVFRLPAGLFILSM